MFEFLISTFGVGFCESQEVHRQGDAQMYFLGEKVLKRLRTGGILTLAASSLFD